MCTDNLTVLPFRTILKHYSETYGEHIMSKIVIVSEKDRLNGDFIDPTGYYIVDAFGSGVYFKTRSRSKAQAMSDEMYGKGKFTVRKSMIAVVS